MKQFLSTKQIDTKFTIHQNRFDIKKQTPDSILLGCLFFIDETIFQLSIFHRPSEMYFTSRYSSIP